MSTTMLVNMKGLDCPNCAGKIERCIKKIDGVEDASVNLMNQQAEVTLINAQSSQDTLSAIKEQVHHIEPDVVVFQEEERAVASEIASHTPNTRIYTLAFGVVVFAAAMLLGTQPYGLRVGLFVGAYLLLGYDVLIRLFKNLRRGEVFDENFLMGIATLGAFAIGEYPEAVAVMLFYQVGEYLQDKAVDKSRRSIQSLVGLKPDTANLVTKDGIVSVSPDTVAIGSEILVKPGERIPIDGIIVKGSSQIDTSALTGESVPIVVSENDALFSGSVNKTQALTIRTNKAYKDSAAVKILEMVQNAASRKAPTEKFITRFARVYTPAVTLLAVMIAVLGPIFTSLPATVWIYRALSFLVVSCPCALVISVPLGYFGGIGSASKKGILVKGGNYLEALQKANTIVFDKTGTLTQGIFDVSSIRPVAPFNETDLLTAAAQSEALSNHPIAKAIVSAYQEQVGAGRLPDAPEQFEEISGYGVKATTAGKVIWAGNDALMARENILSTAYDGIGSVVHIAIDGAYAGYIVVSDAVKEDSASAIGELRNLGVNNIIMMSGDRRDNAEKTAKALGIDTVYAELLPGEKLSTLEEIMAANHNGKTVFVGDGINDAPALTRADVGIAMGALGQDAAIEAADVVIMDDAPSKIATAFRTARATQHIIMQNIVFALGIKAVILVLAAVGLAGMWMAVFADVGVALIAILNSMRKK